MNGVRIRKNLTLGQLYKEWLQTNDTADDLFKHIPEINFEKNENGTKINLKFKTDKAFTTF